MATRTTTDTRQMSAVEEPEQKQKPIEPVKLRTAHDFTLTATALQARAEELKKLSKKNSEEGYAREAKSVEADANAIEFHILPQFRAQRELPLLTVEQVEKEITGALRVFVFRAFDGLDNPKVAISPENIRGRKERVLESIGKRVTFFAREIAERAFNEGVAAREISPESLAMRCIGSLRPVD
jgi:hypothetical protein